MASKESTGSSRRFLIRLTDVEPEVRPQELASALQPLFRKKTLEEVVDLLGRLPVVLSSSATEIQARKIHAFLKPRGAVLKITQVRPAPSSVPKAIPESAMAAKKGNVSVYQSAPRGQPAVLEERRAKPRVHPGIRLHPVPMGDLLIGSLRLFKQHFGLFFSIVFVPQGLFFVLRYGAGLVLGTAGGTALFIGSGSGLRAFGVITFLTFLIVQFWAQCALVFAVSETYLGHSTSIKASYNAIRRRSRQLLGPMLLWAALFFILVVLAVLARIILAVLWPGFRIEGIGSATRILITVIVLIVAIWAVLRLLLNWLLIDKVVVLENIGGMNALRRTDELMNGLAEAGFWMRPKIKGGGILVLGFLIGIGIYQCLKLPELIFSLLAPGTPVAATFMGLLKTISTSLAACYMAVTVILYYYDLRVRQEGFDLKMMVQNL